MFRERRKAFDWAAALRLADRMNGNFNYEIGWPDLVETVAQIRDTLPIQDQATLGILAGDEGEAGAVNLYAPQSSCPCRGTSD